MTPISAVLLICVLVSGCQMGRLAEAPPPEQIPETPAKDQWFCGSDTNPQDGQQWECVETESVGTARANAPPVTRDDPLPTAAPLHPADVADDSVMAQRPAVVQAEREPPVPPPKPPAETEPETTAPAESGDDGARRIRIEDLPPDYYTIQLAAFRNRERLEVFAEKHDLWGLTAAQVKSNDRIFFVLLLGVYETVAEARTRLGELPDTINVEKAWIRKLGSLQNAMKAAADAAPPD